MVFVVYRMVTNEKLSEGWYAWSHGGDWITIEMKN